MIRIPCLVIAASLFLLSTSGCTSLSLPRLGASSVASIKPARCLCLWQPVELEDAAGRPVKGFGGQVYFFEADSEEPVEVDGDVRVFIFDDVGTAEQQARPKSVKDFDTFAWKSFRSESQFGTNYSVFVPYERASRYESTCSLRVRLLRPDGSQLFSDMATVKLPGQPRDDNSIRQLVSPREHSIHPDRSRELRVDLQQPAGTSDRAATIGSIEEGALSLARDDAGSPRSLDDQARLKIQKYEAQLAAMHASFEQRHPSEQRRSTRDVRQEIADLMPAIREVTGRNERSSRRVAPTAHEVFATEEPQHDQPADDRRIDRSATSIWSDGYSDEDSQTFSDSQGSKPAIQSFSRPLRRAREKPSRSIWSEADRVQALELARIEE